MRKIAGFIAVSVITFCLSLVLCGSFAAFADEDPYLIVRAALDARYEKESDGFVHIYIDDSGHGEYDILPKLPENFKYVSQIGPSESGVVQVKFTSTDISGKSYVSVKDNKIILDYDGNPEDIFDDDFMIQYDIESDSNFTFNGSLLFMKVDRASSGIIGTTRIREGLETRFDLELKGYDHDEITWISSDNSVLRPVDGSGEMSAVFLAVSAGRATVSAVVKGNNGIVSVPKAVTVTKKNAGNLNISKATLYTGESVVLEISNLPNGAAVNYSSSSETKVKVDKKTGRITALKKGSATVTAKVDVPASGEEKAYSYKLKSKIKVKDGKATTVTTLKQLESVLTDTKGGKYKIGADIKGIKNITVKKGTYRLDLNGHTLYGKNTDNPIILVLGGNLTITDSKGSGKVINETDQDAVSCSKGTLNIYGGEYMGIVYSVNMRGSGTLNVYGGTMNGYASAICIHSGNVNLYGGTYVQTLDTSAGMVPVNVIRVDAYKENNPVNLKINGGTYTATYGSALFITGAYGYTEINGGCFESGICSVLNQMSGKTVINGGEFYYSHAEEDERGNVLSVGNMGEPLSFTVNDGIFINKSDHIIYIQNTPDIFINGGYFNIEEAEDNEFYTVPYLDIVETFDGTLYLEPGLIEESRIQDETPKGKNLIATEFTRNKTKYKKGMTITNPDDMYSAMMDATENLEPEFRVKCSNDLYKVLLHYSDKWNSGMKDIVFNYEESEDKNSSGGKNTKVLDVTMSVTYHLEFQIEMASHSAASAKNASKEAVAYSAKIDKIVSDTVKKGMSDKEKAVALHDYMVKNYSYDYSFKSDSYRIWGLLDNKKGVCQAYANLYRILCGRAGIECYCISGIGGDPGKMDLHMWNVLKIDGKWLYIDVTFDDSSGTKLWLLKEEEEFYKDGKHVLVA